MKIAYILKPCPWCKRTPKFYIPTHKEGTWDSVIKCSHPQCLVKPETKTVGIRNTSKTLFGRFGVKVGLMVAYWNTGNPMVAREATTIDLSSIEDKFTDFGSYAGKDKWLNDRPGLKWDEIEIHPLLERTEPVYYDK